MSEEFVKLTCKECENHLYVARDVWPKAKAYFLGWVCNKCHTKNYW